ncbi:MAG TPA: DNA repair protein RecO, partial [Terriglobia bacterium]|nr:DNA repair protein RecO [Terriglobia bacterium]
MPLIETEAIVLRTHRLGEADKIASLFTRQMGRIRGVAKGALSRRGRYGAALEPLSYIRVWIYDRESRDLQRVGSAEIVESFFEMQKDYRIQLAAQYLAEVTERFLPDREVNERVFRLLLAVLRAFKRYGEVNRSLLFFDYWLLRLGGFLPDLSR